ncbi:MAG: hypothetical protein KGJ66_07390 [Alphaproteobacteria bacterium]|nr:hypothetical protein [Alphaproteobacteria bacterium]
MRRIALLVLPLLFLAAELVLRAHGLPYWLWFNLDPSYLYLIGGLNLLQHAPPAAFQHPGVPVQLVVAAVAWFTPAADRLKDAEPILARASDVMLALDALALWFMGWRIWRRSDEALTPALFAQLAPFITMLTLKHGIEVEPEPLLLGAVALLVTALVEEGILPRATSLFGVAFAVALGAACKITFAPLGLAPLIVIRGGGRRVAYVVLTAVLFALWMIPEIPNLAPMAAWFIALAKGSGAYGRGPQTVVAWASYPHEFAKLFFARPLFLGAFALGLLALVVGRRGTPGARLLLALLASQLVQIVLVAKHASGHYILPALELAGPVLGLVWLLLVAGRVSPRAGRRLGAVAVVAIVAAQAVAFAKLDAETRSRAAGARSIDLARDLPRCARVYDFMASAPSAAWFYNDSYSGQRYAARLKALLPADDYFFEPWRQGIESWSGPVTAAALTAKYPCIALRSAEPHAVDDLAKQFGARFAHAARCRAGMEDILVAGAACPTPKP